MLHKQSRSDCILPYIISNTSLKIESNVRCFVTIDLSKTVMMGVPILQGCVFSQTGENL